MRRKNALLSLVFLVCALVASDAYGVSVSVPSTSGFLLASSTDTPGAPVIFDLVALGISPGDVLLIDQLGDFSFGTAFPDTGTAMHGVFSSSSTILSQDNLNRVPGAIDAGTDSVTGATFFGALPTDIPEDFRINPEVEIVVPTGASFLFVGVADSFFGDNSDPNQNFAVTVTAKSVPEPSILLLLLSGAAAVASLVGDPRLKPLQCGHATAIGRR
jgi:hypothetical protein